MGATQASESTAVIGEIEIAREREKWQLRQDLPRGKNR